MKNIIDKDYRDELESIEQEISLVKHLNDLKTELTEMYQEWSCMRYPDSGTVLFFEHHEWVLRDEIEELEQKLDELYIRFQ